MKNRIGKTWLAVRCSIVLIGGGASLLSSPTASAQGGINWKNVWKHQIKPRADKRYYTKKKARANFAAKSALAGYTPSGTAYTKAESDGKYAAAGSSYSKADSDAKYLPQQRLVVWDFALAAGSSTSGYALSQINFGVTLSAAPAVSIIVSPSVPPAGCSGSYAAPDAAPGHLCIFVTATSGFGPMFACTAANSCGSADPWGAYIGAQPSGTGSFLYGSWAVRPVALNTSGRVALTHTAGHGIRPGH